MFTAALHAFAVRQQGTKSPHTIRESMAHGEVLTLKPIAKFVVSFSYCQFQIYDRSLPVPACLWTAAHVRQGFSRRSSTASFGTIVDCGSATVRVYLSPYSQDHRHERVICIPFSSPSGSIGIGAPDDWPHRNGFTLEAGHYRLYVAQTVTDESEQVIDLFFEKTVCPISRSAIMVRDAGLDPVDPLLEDSPEPL